MDKSASHNFLLLRIRFWLAIVIIGLLISGATAIPLVSELDFLHRLVHRFDFPPAVREWIQTVYAGILDTNSRYPFMLYGTDWLAFGHFAIAIVFIGPLRDPVRNLWVIDFGIIACLLIIPYAFIFGEIRGIPIWWRLIDCSFGIAGLIPLYLARHATKKLEHLQNPNNPVNPVENPSSSSAASAVSALKSEIRNHTSGIQ
jgi:hypothetical protein